MKTNTSNWMRRLAGLSVLVMVFTSFVGQASARILFQDDTTGVFESENMVVGSNDTGANNTSVTFGADGTASENGKIQWNIGTNSFSVDHTVGITGGLSATGQTNFSGAAGFRMREADPAAAVCTTVNELILSTVDGKIYRCSVVGDPAGTWAVTTPAIAGFEGVYGADGDKVLTTSNGIFTIDTGTNAVTGFSVTGLTNINNSNGAYTTNIGTGTTTGTVSIGGGADQVAINSTTWDISGAGVASGLTGITSTGTVNFSQADATRIQESPDPATFVGCANVGELILDTTDKQIQMCTVTGNNAVAATLADQTITHTADTAGTSGNAISLTIVVGSSDNGGSGATAAVTAVGNAITVTIDNDTDAGNAGANPETVGQVGVRNCLNLAATAPVAGTGVSAGDGTLTCTITNDVTALITSSGGTAATDAVALGATSLGSGLNGTATWTPTAAGDASTLDGVDSTQFLRSDTTDSFTSGTLSTANGTTFQVNGIATIGDAGDTVEVNSSDWKISTTGAVSGIDSIAANDNQAALNTNIGVTGADAGLHTLAFQIDGNTAISVSATGNGAGGVLARTVTIGDATATVGITSSTWNISGPGAISGVTTIGASGNITTSGGTLVVGTTALNETTAANDSGAFLVGTFDEFANSNSTNVQDVLDDLDALIGSNAPNVNELTFYPEYPDVVVYKDTTLNNGTLISDYDSGNRRQYYGWTSSKVALNDIDLRFRYELPADWVATGDLTLQLRTLTNVAADNAVDLVLRNETDNTTCATSATLVGAVANTWEVVTVAAATINAGCAGGNTLAAGDIIEIQIKNYAKSTGEADVGKIQLDYTN